MPIDRDSRPAALPEPPPARVDEALAVAAAYPWPADRLSELTELAGAREGVDIVDIGANLLDDDPPYANLIAAGVARIVGFEPQPEALARLRELAGPQETYLPYAVGDGTRHTLRICAAGGFSSLFEPDARSLALLTDFPDLAAVRARVPVDTVRLDDIAEIGGVDLLKIDAQGSEGMILAAGRRRLASAMLVQVEVAYHRLYAGAPLWSEIDSLLRGAGFVPHGFVSTRTWPLAPVPWADPAQAVTRQLVEADVLYVRDPLDWTTLAAERLRALVVLAAGVYGAHGLGLLALLELERRGELGAGAVTAYREQIARLSPAAEQVTS